MFFFFKQKTAYEMRISDLEFRRVLFRSLRGDQRRSRTVLLRRTRDPEARPRSQHGEVDPILGRRVWSDAASWRRDSGYRVRRPAAGSRGWPRSLSRDAGLALAPPLDSGDPRSAEHTSELQSLMRIS